MLKGRRIRGAALGHAGGGVGTTVSPTDPGRRSMCVAPLNSIFLSFLTSHSMRNRWGNKRGMFYLGTILVYPDNSHLLFFRPDYQQVSGEGGSEGHHVVSFSSSCLLFLICWYSCGIHSISISFHSLHRSQKPQKVYSPLFHLYLVKCWGGRNVSSSRLSFFVSNLLAFTHR